MDFNMDSDQPLERIMYSGLQYGQWPTLKKAFGQQAFASRDCGQWSLAWLAAKSLQRLKKKNSGLQYEYCLSVCLSIQSGPRFVGQWAFWGREVGGGGLERQWKAGKGWLVTILTFLERGNQKWMASEINGHFFFFFFSPEFRSQKGTVCKTDGLFGLGNWKRVVGKESGLRHFEERLIFRVGHFAPNSLL